MYPSLVNCTTIDLFADWPHDALLEVGERYLAQIDLAGDDKVINFSKKILLFLIFRNNNLPVSNGKTVVVFVFIFFTNHFCPFFIIIIQISFIFVSFA